MTEDWWRIWVGAATGTRPRPRPPKEVRLEHFKEPGRTHAAADAHGDDDKAHAPPLALDQGMADHARPRHAIGMADRNSAAIDIVAPGVNAEPVPAIERLDRKRLVELPQPDVVDLEPVLLQQLGHGK